MQEQATVWPYTAIALGAWFDELAAGGIFMTDTSLCVQAWNRWLEIHSGRRAADVIGNFLFDLYPDLVTRGLDQLYRDALAGEVRVAAQRFHGYLLPLSSRMEGATDRTQDGLMPQSARIVPLRVAGEIIGTITVIEDVTERVMSERELRNRIAALDLARTTAEAAVRTKDEFLATLSHELRTPLNAVLGWTRLMRAGQMDTATFKRALEVVDRNATAQAQLIEDLLDIARIMQGKLRLDLVPTDILPVVRAAVDVVRPTAEAKGLFLVTDIEPDAAVVVGDANRLQQVAWNLLSNAVKFTPKGGTVAVRVRVRGGMVDIAVQDNGKGIAPAFLPYVFDRFRQEDSTTTRRYGGLGLGLSLVRQIVELHGGTAAASSAGEGHGAMFSFSLPLQPPLSATRISRWQTTNTPAHADLAGRRILLVEDECDTRELLCAALTRHGAHVLAVATTTEAYDVIAGNAGGEECPELIVADIGMPNEDGYTLMHKVRLLNEESGGRLPALAVTGYGSPEDRERALAAGFNRHLAKPVDPVELAATIVELLGPPRSA